MKFKIFTLLFVIALAIIGYFAYPILMSRYFSANQSKEEPRGSFMPIGDNANKPAGEDPMSNSNQDTSENADLENFLSGEKTETAKPSPTININERNTSGSETLAHITTEHCNNDCNAFTMDFKLLEYCQQVCGIAPIKDVSNCDDKKNIEKDYCLKDLAVTKKDASLCESIKDANIKLTCQNRITEDIIESQTK